MRALNRLRALAATRLDRTTPALRALAEAALAGRPLIAVDIGALGGLMPELIPIQGFIKAIGFDPDLAECDRLNANAADRGLPHRFLPYAVTGRDGVRRLHVLRKAATSSLLEPNREYFDRFADPERVDKVGEVEVQTRALGPLLAAEDIEAEFLKLDAHGVEDEILASLDPDQLRPILAVHIELLLADLYQGQSKVGTVHDRLRSAGLELYSMKRYVWRRAGFDATGRRSRGQLAFADALYLKRTQRLSTEQQRRLAVVAAAFRHYDFAHELVRGDERLSRKVMKTAPRGRATPWESDGAGDWL